MTYVLALIFIMLFVIFVANSERRVPLQQTGKALSSDKTTISSFLPFKINIAGILPVIFASTIMSGMQMIVNYLQMTDANK